MQSELQPIVLSHSRPVAQTPILLSRDAEGSHVGVVVTDVAFGQAHMADWLRALSARIVQDGDQNSLELRLAPDVSMTPRVYFVTLGFADTSSRSEHRPVRPTDFRVIETRIEPSESVQAPALGVMVSWAIRGSLWVLGMAVFFALAYRLPTTRAARKRRLDAVIAKAQPGIARHLRVIAREAERAALAKGTPGLWTRLRGILAASSPTVAALAGSLSLLLILGLPVPVVLAVRFSPSLRMKLGALALVLTISVAVWLTSGLRSRLRMRMLVKAASTAERPVSLAELAFPELENAAVVLGRQVSLDFDAVPAAKPDMSALKPGGLCRLRVNLGRVEGGGKAGPVEPEGDLAQTLPEESQPPVEFVAYGLDFRLVSQDIQRVALPPLGPAPQVDFFLRAPLEAGPARLRLGVFHRDRLIQSFKITIAIGESKAFEILQREREFRPTEDFHAVGELPGRLLSIAINEYQGSHTLTFKSAGVAGTFSPSEKLVSGLSKKVRQKLSEATFKNPKDPKSNNFSTRPKTPGIPDEFRRHLPALAKVGSELYVSLFRVSKGLTPTKIAEIANAQDGKIQIVRHVPEHALPWNLLYDFDLPTDPNAPVCNGTEGGQPCKHGKKSNTVYCVRGFWGIRHEVEQVIDIRHEPTPEEWKVGDSVRVLVGEFDGSPDFEKSLLTKLGESIKTPPPEKLELSERFLEGLQNPKTRPGALIVLGHVQKRPDGPRIPLRSPDVSLTPGDLTAQSMDVKAWEGWAVPPHTMIFFMACGSAAIEVGNTDDFALEAYRLGAIAVVGTECSIFTALGERFAEEVVSAVFGKDRKPLGSAITEFRRALAREGNPLGLVFSLLGAAEVGLSPGRKQ
jgi:hypothetical protein